MNIEYNNDNTDVNNTLYNAQLLVDAFAKTIENNNCLNMLPISLHQNIDNTIKDINDTIDAGKAGETLTSNTTSSVSSNVLDSVSDAVKQHKNSCFNCKLEVPNMSFKFDPTAALNKLKALIKLYKSSLNKMDLCQVGYSLQSNCLPDIIKLIVILLTAYLTIMSLKVLSNFSISVFIKGVISKLFSLLVGSFKISIDIGATNIYCLINALKEIALAVPTSETIANQLNDQQKAQLGLSEVKNKIVSNFNKGLDSLSIDSKIQTEVNNINKSFDTITSTVDKSLKSIEDRIQSLLGLKDHMEGEDIRLGLDITEVFTTINNLTQVLNLLSSIALSLAKQQVRDKMCKTSDTASSLSNSAVSDNFNKDIVQEYNNKVTDIQKSDDKVLSLLVHDKPVTNGLPKIDLYDCSIDDFIEAHTLPNIIKVAQEQVKQEINSDPTYSITGAIPGSTYSILKPDDNTKDLIQNIVDMIYIPNTTNDNTTDTTSTVDNPLDTLTNPLASISSDITESLNDLINNRTSNDNTLKCKSIDDVMDILKNIKR